MPGRTYRPGILRACSGVQGAGGGSGSAAHRCPLLAERPIAMMIAPIARNPTSIAPMYVKADPYPALCGSRNG